MPDIVPTADDGREPTASALPSVTAAAVPSLCPVRTSAGGDPDFPVGSVISMAFDDEYLSRLYRLDLRNQSVEPYLADLPRGYVEKIHTSPDGRWLAFVFEENDATHAVGKQIVTASGDEQNPRMMPLPTDLEAVELSQWLLDGQRITAYPPFDQAQLPGNRPDRMLVIEPFSSETNTLETAFPYEASELWEYWGRLGGSVAYDSSLSRAVYLDDATHWVLFDVQKSTVLWRAFLFGVPFPAWAADGSGFAYPIFLNGLGGAPDPSAEANDVGLVVVSREGQEWHSPSVAKVKTGITTYGISPHGRYVWFRVEDGTLPPGLYVWDRQSDRLLDCFVTSAVDPIWSTSDEQFIVQPTGSPGSATFVWIVDMESSTYVEAPMAGTHPVAWLHVP
mgnify:CR=1 FL=1